MSPGVDVLSALHPTVLAACHSYGSGPKVAAITTLGQIGMTATHPQNPYQRVSRAFSAMIVPTKKIRNRPPRISAYLVGSMSN